MDDRLVIELLEFEGFVGIDESERTVPQALAVDLELSLDFSDASSTDNLKNTVDYAVVAERILAIGKQEQFVLIETLAERLAEVIMREHPVRKMELWVRKLHPPLDMRLGSVGARIVRHSGYRQHTHNNSPASWLAGHRHLLKSGRALDLASGNGRNALYLAKEGFTVEAWDRNEEALAALAAKARESDLSITTRLVDLERDPSIPAETFDLVIIFYYLQRNLIPGIMKALRPGGIVVYETFLIDNHVRYNHPRHREFCLEHNELLALFHGLRILAYREGADDQGGDPQATFLASLVAERQA
jgi:FolB domain-containing protein